ncbi:MAG: hypothetical protein ACRENN_01060, partial [Candidatus Eiseniibacteriota bacterium]
TDLTDRLLVEHKSVEGKNLEICYREATLYNAPKLRGKPSPERDWFPVLQAGTLVRLDRQEDRKLESTSGGSLAMDLGAMKNIGSTMALGASAYFAGDPDQTRYGAKLRFRRWLSRSLAIDVAPGIILPGIGEDSYHQYNDPGFVGELSLGVGDWGFLTGQVESRKATARNNYAFSSDGYPRFIPVPREETETRWYLGVKLGGEFSPVALLLSAFAVGALAEGGTQFNPF